MEEDAAFETRFHALRDVEHHIEDEETTMFPQAEVEVGEDCRSCWTRCCTRRKSSRRNRLTAPGQQVCAGAGLTSLTSSQWVSK